MSTVLSNKNAKNVVYKWNSYTFLEKKFKVLVGSRSELAKSWSHNPDPNYHDTK